MTLFTRLCAALVPLMALSGCLLSPGKFTSSLDIRKDGAFTFAYVGEVLVADPSDKMPDMGEAETGKDGKEAASAKPIDKTKDVAAKMREIADALSKEKGFRSVKYLDENKLSVDYQISGRLDHSFLFPFNIDAKAIIPFVAVEVRTDGKVRMQAPAFGSDNESSPGAAMGGMGAMGGGESDTKERNGTFILTTDAEVISQNQEDGVASGSKGKQIVWKITPATHTAPMAVLKLMP